MAGAKPAATPRRRPRPDWATRATSALLAEALAGATEDIAEAARIRALTAREFAERQREDRQELHRQARNRQIRDRQIRTWQYRGMTFGDGHGNFFRPLADDQQDDGDAALPF